ncbi:MAG: aspartate/glutamate racemase family protein [Pseudomonadota bacterium]
MKLALVNPNTSITTTEVMVGIASREAVSGVAVSGLTAPFGASLITEPGSLARAADAVVALIPDLQGADAVIVAAFGDPGLSDLRQRLTVPITGIAEAGMAEAASGGRCFAVVTTTPDLKEQIAATAARYGHSHFAGTWTTPGDPVETTTNAADLAAALRVAIQDAVRDGGAEAIVVGGGPLARAAQELSAVSPVPIIEPIPAAVRLSLRRMQETAVR